jgi:5-formyltetrahydrofolate cyclo-ligase
MSGDPTEDWKHWRHEQRRRLLEERNALSSASRRARSEQAIANLDIVLRDLPVKTLGLYWPIKREIDLLQWAAKVSTERRIALALPVVTVPRTPLDYVLWQPCDAMIRGFWNIPEPAQKRPANPDVVIAPLVGFCGLWRLGYGGGYFDRTLAARVPKPVSIGIGFESTRMPSFAPRDHDIPMKLIVTDRRISNSDG